MMISVFCPGQGQTEPISAAGRPVYAAPEYMDYAKEVFQDVGALTEEPRLRRRQRQSFEGILKTGLQLQSCFSLRSLDIRRRR